MHHNGRLEAFCDGVFAIALTLLIIDVKLPGTAHIETTSGLWLALRHLVPNIFAFVLSFGIIFISWVNHHQTLKLVDKSSPRFIYANGFMLLTIVSVPFPTALLGENLLTDHASPAVVLYSAVNALLAVTWWLLSRTALGPRPLTRNDEATTRLRKIGRDACFAFVLYTACAIIAVWFPLATAAVITITWCVWLSHSLKLRAESAPDVGAPAAGATSSAAGSTLARAR